jgi:DNA polymerase sigma
VVILKQIIYAYNLADPYTGGLGSYSLTLMVVALLQVFLP